MPSVPHLSFANVTLPLAPSWLETLWMRVIHDAHSFDYADFWGFDNGASHLPTPSLPRPPHFKLGVLTWPTGASRPAFFHTLVNTSRMESIRSAIGSSSVSKALLFFDGRTGKTVTAQMFALPERPLNHLGNEFSDLWLLTLTDQRFYWHWRRGNITQPLSYTHLYAQLATILGVAITPEGVNSAYGTPSAKWVLPYTTDPATTLDAAASQCGQRVVVALDGSVRTVNWETARTASDAYVAANSRVISGGLISEAVIARYVPASINTLFADLSPGANANTPRVVNNTLVSLGISQYGSATGVSGTSQVVYGDLPYTGANSAALNAFAAAAAEDWYGWRLCDLDLVYGGIEPWVPTGWEDTIEWTLKLVEENPAAPLPTDFDDPIATTLVRRGPWTDFETGDWLSGITPIPCSWIPGGCPTGSGSGSGSGGGSGCGVTILPVEFDCDNGVRRATVKEIAVGIEDNQLVIQECDEETFDLGACSPVSPEGYKVPVSQKVCPIFDTIQYLDWDSQPQSKQVVVGIRVERVLVTVPVVQAVGCIEFEEADCCSGSGSGSGAGAECTELCDQCLDGDGVSTEWELYLGDDPVPVILTHVTDPADGNYCRFLSDGGRYELAYDYGEEAWVLTDYDAPGGPLVWATLSQSWSCHSENLMLPAEDGQVDAVVVPVHVCPAGSGVVTECCPDDTWPNTLTVLFGVGTDDLACLSGLSKVVTYNPTEQSWIGSQDITCVGHTDFYVRVICVLGLFQVEVRRDIVPGVSWEQLLLAGGTALDCAAVTFAVSGNASLGFTGSITATGSG